MIICFVAKTKQKILANGWLGQKVISCTAHKNKATSFALMVTRCSKI
jgi:hypothetical protein